MGESKFNFDLKRTTEQMEHVEQAKNSILNRYESVLIKRFSNSFILLTEQMEQG